PRRLALPGSGAPALRAAGRKLRPYRRAAGSAAADLHPRRVLRLKRGRPAETRPSARLPGRLGNGGDRTGPGRPGRADRGHLGRAPAPWAGARLLRGVAPGRRVAPEARRLPERARLLSSPPGRPMAGLVCRLVPAP